MQYWQALGYTPVEELVDVARTAEEVGFEGLLLSDHVFVPQTLRSKYPYKADGKPDFDGSASFPDVFQTISVLAQHTRRLRFATNVYILPLRHPVEVAKFVGTAAVYSGNRAILGIGAGWMRDEFDVLGRKFDKRGERMDEAIEVIRKLTSGQVVSHEGEHYAFPPMAMQPAPTRPVPIWIGGQNRAALRRAGQLADGWSGSGQSFEEAEHVLLEIARIRREAGRESLPFEAVVPLPQGVTDDQRARLVELGMTATVSYPFPYTIGRESTLQQKLDYLCRFGDDVIGRDPS